jgi:tetratricopeptide (TPR) repeat protein
LNIDALKKMIDSGRDSAVLRLTLARLYGEEGDHQAAVGHLQKALELDPAYTAAWKQLGKALLETGDGRAAAAAWDEGIRVARENGDKQAEKEMGVFLKRLHRE